MGQVPQLRPYQAKAIDDIRAAIRQGKKRIVLRSEVGSGKCLGKGTPILMFDGKIKPVENVQVGDLLMGPDSKPRVVVSISRGREELYKVIPVKGDPYVVNKSHILSLRLRPKTGGPDNLVNISVSRFLLKDTAFKRNVKGWRVPVHFPDTYLPTKKITPYFLGIWIGDGDSSGPTISTIDQEIIDYLTEYAQSRMLILRSDYTEGKCPRFHIAGRKTGRGMAHNMVRDGLKELNVLENKHIPHEYLTSSFENRLQLLAGLMDSDGNLSNGGYDYISKIKTLSYQVAFLARSVGLAAYVTETEKTCTNNGYAGTYWRVSISGHTEIVPCLLPRKKASKRLQKKDVLRTSISVEPIGVGDYYGFEIAPTMEVEPGWERLFVLGDFTVTHNTTIFSSLVYGLLAKGTPAMVVCNRQKLVRQAVNRLKEFGVNPYVLMQTGMPATNTPVIVASADTLRHREWPNWIRFIIIDECHLANFTKVLDKAVELGIYVLGVSATPIPNKSNRLNEYYQQMITTLSTEQHIIDGHLVWDCYYAPKSVPDTKGMATHKTAYGTDFSEKALYAVYNKPKVYDDMIQNWLKMCKGMRTVCFCISVEHSKNTAENFRRHGISAIHLDGNSPEHEREAAQAAFERGEYKVLCNCAIFTFGWDCPSIECVIVNRATASYELWRQMIGRGARPWADKQVFWVIDQGNNFRRHGGLTDEIEWSLMPPKKRKKGDKLGVAPRKECPKCEALVPTSTMECPSCGHKWKPKVSQLGKAEFEVVMPKTLNTWPLRSEYGSVSEYVRDCIRYSQQKGYKPGAILHQIKSSPEAVTEYGRIKGYKQGWEKHQKALTQ